MIFENLTSDNIILYLAKAYDKPNMILSEFEDDLLRFNYIKKIIKRYKTHKDINVNLLLNHIIIMCNVFGPEVTVRSLFFKISKEDFSVIKTMLLFLNIMPDIIKGIRGNDIISSDISVDMEIANKLRNIK